MATATTDPLVGRLVDGRYEVVSRIARGGMATVYLALDTRLDRQVALKVMHPHLAEGPAGARFVARFRREARAAARLSHPAIVAVYDQGTDGDTSYLAMEYVPGTTLRHALHHDGPFTLGRTLDILETVCEALAVAHRAGLVHRDVKPENVLLDADGRARITDFGLARAVDEVSATSTGTVLGTVAYLAPELIASGTADARCDVYALGIMAHELVTGVVPHRGSSPIQVAFQHVNSDVPPPSDLVAYLPTEVDELVCALTARDPAQRPLDATAALALVRSTRAALHPAELSRAATPAPPDALGASEAATAQFGPMPVGTGAVPGPGPDPHATDLIDFRPAVPPAPRQAPHPNPDAPDPSGPQPAPRPRARRAWVVATIAVLLAAVVGGGLWWWMGWGPGAYTTVPSGLVGVAQADAEAALAAAGLDHTAERQYHDTVPDGSVVSAEPGTGDRIRTDGVVHLVVSRGILMLTVPTGLIGQGFEEATAALTGAGFAVAEPVTMYSDTEPAGQVLGVAGPDGSAVADGASLPHSTPLTLTVSGGPEPIVVADVDGLTEADAVAALEAQGLVVTVTRQESETIPEGEVISQDPGAEADAHRTDTATIVVSTGPPMVDLPNLYGKNAKDAQAILEAAGFEVTIEYPQGLHPFNLVYSQSPEGGDGKQARKGSTVTLNVF